MVLSKAVLIIDMQVCHFPPGDLPHRAEEVLAAVRSLLDRARRAEVPVIFVQHCGEIGSEYEPGTPGWQVHPRLAPIEGEETVRKGHPDSFQGTGLQELLDRKGITDLVVTGMQSEMCIDTTVRRAYSLSYAVELVADGHTTWSSSVMPAESIVAHHNHVLGRRFARTVGHDAVEL